MKRFLETTFGPTELGIVESVFTEWVATTRIDKSGPDAELAAAIIINLFREGNITVPQLQSAVAGHRGLADLGHEHMPGRLQ